MKANEAIEAHQATVTMEQPAAGSRRLDRRTQWSLYGLLIVISGSMMVARVARVRSPDPKSPTPFLSANDRSRWATIRALVHEGTYAVDRIVFDERGERVLGWHTIDLVRHRGPDGREHYYSSKPTLLTTLLAGEYWVIRALAGAALDEEPHYVARLMLVLTNVLPLVAALILLARLIDELAATEAARIFAVAAASFGTFLTTFAITLNNHLPAAVSLVFALAASVPVWSQGRRQWWRLAAAGFCFAFLAANELPALSLLVLAGVGLAWKAPWQTLVGFVPAALVVAAAAIGTNLVAHGDWRPPYAHRSDGPVVARVADRLAVELNEGKASTELLSAVRGLGVEVSDRAVVEPRVRGERWVLWDEATQRRLALVRTPEGAPRAEIEVRQWDNWYDYEGSYWMPDKLKGTDRGEPSRGVYAFHVLIGHHGIFSLTPIWLLSAAGCVIWLVRGARSVPGERAPPEGGMEKGTTFALALTTVVITLVVVGFYLSRPQIDRNYSGVSCCLRWLIWFAPLWLLTLVPAADWLAQRRWGRRLAVALLAVSVFSAHYAADNPFSHPWLFDYWTSLGWIEY